MYFNQDFLDFFIELAANNQKEWMDDNRARYHSSVKGPFENFVGDLVLGLHKIDSSIQPNPKDCIFRINKDIRFSKDKSPYKTDRSAVLSKFGRKNKEYPGYYVRLSPESCQIGGGAYSLQKENLLFLREKILFNADEWHALIADKKFIKHFKKGVQGEKNKLIPREFKGKELTSDYIMNKQFYFMSDHSPDIILRKDLVQYCLDRHKTTLKIKNFMAEVFES